MCEECKVYKRALRTVVHILKADERQLYDFVRKHKRPTWLNRQLTHQLEWSRRWSRLIPTIVRGIRKTTLKPSTPKGVHYVPDEPKETVI